MGLCMNAIINIIKTVYACCYLCVKATSSFPRCNGHTYLVGWRGSRAVSGRRQQQQSAPTTRENVRTQDPRGEEHGDHKTFVKKKGGVRETNFSFFFLTNTFLFRKQVAPDVTRGRSTPKNNNTPPRTSKCLPWGGVDRRVWSESVCVCVVVGGLFLVPNILCLPGIRLDVCLNRNEKKEKKKKKQAASSSHCASFKQDSVYCFSPCCISNNSGVDGRQQERERERERERECVCVSDRGAQRRNIPACVCVCFFFIYSAACCSAFFLYSALW